MNRLTLTAATPTHCPPPVPNTAGYVWALAGKLYAAVVDVVDDPAVVDVVDDAGVANVWGGVQGEYPALLWDRT